MLLSDDLHVVTANRAFYSRFQLSKDETEGRRIYDVGNGQWDIPDLHQLLHDILSRGTAFRDVEIPDHSEPLGPHTLLIKAQRITPEAGKGELILLAIEDITKKAG